MAILSELADKLIKSVESRENKAGKNLTPKRPDEFLNTDGTPLEQHELAMSSEERIKVLNQNIPQIDAIEAQESKDIAEKQHAEELKKIANEHAAQEKVYKTIYDKAKKFEGDPNALERVMKELLPIEPKRGDKPPENSRNLIQQSSGDPLVDAMTKKSLEHPDSQAIQDYFRNPQTLEQIVNKVKETGLNNIYKKVSNRKPDDPINSNVAVGSLLIQRQLQKDAIEKSQKALAPNATDNDKFDAFEALDRVENFGYRVNGIGSEAGRTLNSFGQVNRIVNLGLDTTSNEHKILHNDLRQAVEKVKENKQNVEEENQLAERSPEDILRTESEGDTDEESEEARKSSQGYLEDMVKNPEKAKEIIRLSKDPEFKKTQISYKKAKSIVAKSLVKNPKLAKEITDLANDPEIQELAKQNVKNKRIIRQANKDNPEENAELAEKASDPDTQQQAKENVKNKNVVRQANMDNPEENKVLEELANDPKTQEQAKKMVAAKRLLKKAMVDNPKEAAEMLKVLKDPKVIEAAKDNTKAKALLRQANLDNPEENATLAEKANDPKVIEAAKDNTKAKALLRKANLDNPEENEALAKKANDLKVKETAKINARHQRLLRQAKMVVDNPEEVKELRKYYTNKQIREMASLLSHMKKGYDPILDHNKNVDAKVSDLMDGIKAKARTVGISNEIAAGASTAKLMADDQLNTQLLRYTNKLSNVEGQKESFFKKARNLSSSLMTDLFYNYALSQFATLERNIIGNSVNMLWDWGGRLGAPITGRLRQLAMDGTIQGGENYRMSLNEAMAFSEGAVKAMGDGLFMAMKTMRTGKQYDNMGKFTAINNHRTLSAENLNMANQSWKGRFINMVGHYTNVYSTAMGATDSFFKTIANRGHTNYQIRKEINRNIRIMTANNATDEEIKNYVDKTQKELLQNPPDNMLASSVQYARQATYQESYDRNMAGLINNKFVNNVLMRIMYFPFVRTTSNMIRQFCTDHLRTGKYAIAGVNNVGARIVNKISPENFSDIPIRNMTGDVDPIEVDKSVAKIAFGWGMGLSVTSLLHHNNIILTGKEPSDPGARNAWKRMGVGPYSFVIPQENGAYNSYSYNGWSEPFGFYLGTLANFHFAMNSYDNDSDLPNALGTFAMGTADMMLDLPFMQGLKQLTQALENPNVSTGVSSLLKQFGTTTGQIAGSILPTTSRTVGSTFDAMGIGSDGIPTELDNIVQGGHWGLTESFLKSYIKTISNSPFYSGKKETRLNYWGEPMDSKSHRLEATFNPMRIVNGKYNAVDAELIRNRIGLPVPSHKIGKIELTTPEQNSMIIDANTMSIKGKTMLDALLDDITSDDYLFANNFKDRETLLSATATKYWQRARKNLIKENPERFAKADPIQQTSEEAIR